MKVEVRATVIEGYSDKPTGRPLERVSFTADLAGIPHKGDSVETGYGEQRVEWTHFRLDGSVIVSLATIYTTEDSMDDVLPRFGKEHSYD